MKISQKYKEMELQLQSMLCTIKEMQKSLALADKDWPDHQVIPFCDWQDRDKTPPAGKIWASDGIGVWLINSEGEPIAKEATAVKFWSIAFIPGPPCYSEKNTIR